MISRISGKLKDKKEGNLLVDVGGICYEILVPRIIMKALENTVGSDGTVSLVTFHYHQVEPARSTPVLIGFLNEVEKEFFERFITVSGVGPKAAVKALAFPIPLIAKAIDTGDIPFLKSLPGIGEQRAKEIIAKLQGKVGKFGLIKDECSTEQSPAKEDIRSEAMEVLLQLQYKQAEAKQMIEEAIKRNPEIKTTEDILNEVYRQRTDTQKKKVESRE